MSRPWWVKFREQTPGGWVVLVAQLPDATAAARFTVFVESLSNAQFIVAADRPLDVALDPA